MKLGAIAFVSIALAGCAVVTGGKRHADVAVSPTLLEDLLASDSRLAPLAREAQAHRLQIVLGTVVTDANGHRRLEQQSWRAGAEYIYPASAIKLFGAAVVMGDLLSG